MTRPFSDDVLVKELADVEALCGNLVERYRAWLDFPENHRGRVAPLTRDDRKTIFELATFVLDVVGSLRFALKDAAERKVRQ